MCGLHRTSYADIAARLAKGIEALQEMRLTIRRKILASAAMDPNRYMDSLEEVYGSIFAKWERSAGDENREMELLARRLKRFLKARSDERWADAAAPGGRLASAGVNLRETLIQMADVCYHLSDKIHTLYWTRWAERVSPEGRSKFLAWMGWAEEARNLALSSVRTRRQMLCTLDEKKDTDNLFTVVRMQQACQLFSLGEMEESKRLYLEASLTGKDIFERSGAYGGSLLCYNNLETTNENLYEKSLKYSDFFRGVKKYSHKRKRRHDKIRVGYISADFRYHVMFHFCWPFFAYSDKTRFEVYAYSRTEKPDFNTEILKRKADVWRDISKKEYPDIAEMIYEDEVDILFDLAGHTAGGALAALAYKPAPIEISGLGYMATTGLSAVDYFLTDSFVDPPGEHEHSFSEELLRVSTQFCYAATGTDPYPESKGAPSKKRGWVLFGAFNQYKKITDEMLLLWKEILARTPKSRILLKSSVFGSVEVSDAAYRRMKNLGFPMERVYMEPATDDYMNRYLEDVDIALDTFPWPGGGTTCDALYMGVPVVSIYSDKRGSRFSYGILSTAGLGELTAKTPKEYVEKAVALANDPELLDALHKNLRKMMEASPLMDAPRYMREVEANYEMIWRKWCDGE